MFLTYFTELLKGTVVHVVTDSTMAMLYLNTQVRTISPALCRESMLLWDLAIQQGITLYAIHIAGTDNSKADVLSSLGASDHERSLKDT